MRNINYKIVKYSQFETVYIEPNPISFNIKEQIMVSLNRYIVNNSDDYASKLDEVICSEIFKLNDKNSFVPFGCNVADFDFVIATEKSYEYLKEEHSNIYVTKKYADENIFALYKKDDKS